MKKLIFTFLFAGAVFSQMYGFSPVTVAVIEPEARGDSRIDTVTAIASLQTALVNRREFTVVERSRLDSVLEEMELEMSGLVNSEDAAQVGQFVGAQQILSGTISFNDDYYVINMQSVDVETGVLLYADQVMCRERDEILEIMPVLAKRLGKLARGKTVKPFEMDEPEEETPQTPVRPPRERRNRDIFSGTGWEFSFLAGNGVKFTNSSLFGAEAAFLIPADTLLQFDIGLGFLTGELTEYSGTTLYRINPGLRFNVIENRLFIAGFKGGAAYQYATVRPNDGGLFSGVFRYHQLDMTLSADGGIKIGQRYQLRLEWEYGFPIRYWPGKNESSITPAERENYGINLIDSREGLTTSLLMIKFDILF